jgi:hypothetical protein
LFTAEDTEKPLFTPEALRFEGFRVLVRMASVFMRVSNILRYAIRVQARAEKVALTASPRGRKAIRPRRRHKNRTYIAERTRPKELRES